jgi:hypothetical protein
MIAVDQIKILNLQLRPDDGRPLRAFVDVELPGGTIIRSLRVIQETGKRPVIQCPQASIKEPGRPLYFKTLITLPDAVKGDVDLAVLNAWKEAVAGQKENQNATHSIHQT